MRNERWVWPEVRDAGTSGAGAVPLRSAQMMGQQQQQNKTKKTKKKRRRDFRVNYTQSARIPMFTFNNNLLQQLEDK